MSTQQVSQGAAGAAGPPQLPDINAQTYPFGMVQHLLDEAAFFNMLAVSDPAAGVSAITAPNRPSEVIGWNVHGVLHRLDVQLHPPVDGRGLWARNVVGRQVATFPQRWLLMPEGFGALPGREPPPTALDPSRSQRFVMLLGTCAFDSGDSFGAFGTGSTMPGKAGLEAAAVGTILEGSGKFADHQGTLTLSGTLDAEQGFVGNLLCRAMDPQGTLRTDRDIPPAREVPHPAPGVTYLGFRGQKQDQYVKTYYDLTPTGGVQGFHLEQELRIFDLRFTTEGHLGLRANASLGQVIGSMKSRVFLDFLNPGAPGTDLSPIPFDSRNEYTFDDPHGESIGGFLASGGEGRTFTLTLPDAPGQQALRFGAFQPISEGTGQFDGYGGILTDNSVVGVAPHVTATHYTVRINDPNGQFRGGR